MSDKFKTTTLKPMEFLKPIEAIEPINLLEVLKQNNSKLDNEYNNYCGSDVDEKFSVDNNNNNSSSKKKMMISVAKEENNENIMRQANPQQVEDNITKSKLPTTLKESTDEIKNERGCYLTFETVNEGTLFLNWSETAIETAYAFFIPTKSVPKFKFKQNGGKSELIRGLRGGTGKGMTRYFQGWVQFIKLAREYKSSNLHISECRDVALYFLQTKSNNSINSIPENSSIDTNIIDAISAIPHNSTTFEGVATMTRDFFTGTGNREGASLSFQ